MRASNKAGLDVPWVWTRHQLARLWGCFPWEVDEAPYDEVLRALEIANLEGENAQKG
ncbi:MAG: hypothetical protein IPL28_25920 [Chloroflexi bacterium]|nr:hypothetical protein [Chloroflexota bacterium]